MVLPSLADVLVVMILVVPGFVAVKIFARITAFDRKLSDFDTTVYSLGTSLAIYVPFILITGLDNIDKIRDSILLPCNLGLIVGLSVGTGGLTGIAVKLLFRRKFKWGDVWHRSVVEIQKRLLPPFFVIVHTDKQEIVGQLLSAGTGEQPKDLLIFQPKLIIRNPDFSVKEQMDLGSDLFIPEDSIRSIVFLSKPLPQN